MIFGKQGYGTRFPLAMSLHPTLLYCQIIFLRLVGCYALLGRRIKLNIFRNVIFVQFCYIIFISTNNDNIQKIELISQQQSKFF